ncbi:MAG: thioesterase II family protein [Pseudonocardiaceae bacterium]
MNPLSEGWPQVAQPPHSTRWVRTLRKASKDPRIRLICLPYAGGGTGVFRTWPEGIGDTIELVSVVLPGRGSRISEPPYDAWEPLLGDAFTALSPYLSEPHAFYGHSFGGRLAYELAQMAQTEHDGVTRHLFISGCRCPGSPQSRPYLHQLSEGHFLAALRSTYGVPRELVDDEVMMKRMLPALRSDIKLAELWEGWNAERLRVPITAIYGHDDLIDNWVSMRRWFAYTEVGCELIEIPGGHFLADTNSRKLLQIINARLGSERATGSSALTPIDSTKQAALLH